MSIGLGPSSKALLFLKRIAELIPGSKQFVGAEQGFVPESRPPGHCRHAYRYFLTFAGEVSP